MKKVANCPNGSFSDFRQRLLSGERGGRVPCQACERILVDSCFSFETMQNHIANALDDDIDSPVKKTKGSDGEQAEVEKEQPDPMEYLRKFPYLQLLQPGDFGKRCPLRCTLCKSKKQPLGKNFELDQLKYYSVKHFVDQHADSSLHQQNAAAHAEGRLGTIGEVDCEGLDVNNSEIAGHLYIYRDLFAKWASMANLNKLAKHTYWYNGNTSAWCIRSASCTRKVPSQSDEDHAVCRECRKLGGAHSVTRSITRFGTKYYFARLLSARLFQGKKASEKVEAEIKNSPLYKRDSKRLDELLKLKNGQLQQFVGGSWLSNPSAHNSDLQSDFVSTIVKPCMQVNVQSVPDNFADVLCRMSACIASGEVGDSDMATLRVAAGVMHGKLDGHPLLHGLALQCLRLVDKQERGLESMKGRRSLETDRETELIADAGFTLAIAGGNKQLAKQFL